MQPVYTRKYAGIGSRQTPIPVCGNMTRIAYALAGMRYTLRSGHALRADQAFEAGSDEHGYGAKEIYTAEDARAFPLWLEHAAKFHPAWDRCDEYARLLHGRNSAIMLGPTLTVPVDFVVCFTTDGQASGGTGQALRIAKAYGIPVFNLHNPRRDIDLFNYVKEIG